MSGIEWLRQVHDRSIPATHAEGDALRLASGDLGFSNFWNLEAGVQVRYHWSLPDPVPASSLWTALKPGTAAIIIGSLPAWPSGSHWRRWDPGSTADHATFAYRFDASDNVWWCDPLAPVGIGYSGEVMPKAELLRFIGLKSWGQLVAPILEAEMLSLANATPSLVDLPLSMTLYRLDKTKVGSVTSPRFGLISFQTTDPIYRVVFTEAGGILQALLCQAKYVLNVRPLSGPDTTPYSQAQLDAATKTGWNEARQAAANAAGAALLGAVPAK